MQTFARTYYIFLMQKKYNVSKTNVTLHQNNYLDKKQLTLIKSNDEAGKHSNPA